MRGTSGSATWWRRFALEDAGVSATEYAILLALLVLVAMGTVAGIGRSMQGIYDSIDQAVPG